MNSSTPTGTLRLRRIPAPPRRPLIRNIDDAIRYGTPQRIFNRRRAAWQKANAENFQRSLADQAGYDAGRIPLIGHLWLAVVRRNGDVEDLGLVSCRVVTTAGVNFIVDAFQNLVEIENMKYHGVGTGAGAEAVGNTALTTELTTQYAAANTRATGTTGELSGNPNTYETTATVTVSATAALTEHGVFSQAAAPGGVLLDRSVFAVVTLAASESLQATYNLAFPSGS